MLHIWRVIRILGLKRLHFNCSLVSTIPMQYLLNFASWICSLLSMSNTGEWVFPSLSLIHI